MAKKDKKKETPVQEDKLYSYFVADSKGVMKRRIFKYSERTPEDIHHFVKEIGDAWDKSPIDSKVTFMLSAFPRMRAFLKQNEPELLIALLADPDELRVVN